MGFTSARRGAAVVAVAVTGLLAGATGAHGALTAPTNGAVYRGDVPFNEDTGGRSRSALTPADTAGGPSTLDTQPELDASAGLHHAGDPAVPPEPESGRLPLEEHAASSNATNPLRKLPASRHDGAELHDDHAQRRQLR